MIDPDEILRFFDEKPAGSSGHATSIAAVLGEDLALGLAARRLEEVNGSRCQIITKSPTTGKRKGPRLDGWILEERSQD